MTLDGLAVACLTDELHERLLGHRVQHIHHCGQDALALECYGTGRRSWLVICTHPGHPAVYVSSSRPPRPADEVTPLLLRLRKLVDGAVIAGVSSPPLERIVRIELDGRTDGGPYRVSLVVEILGPGSVAVLLDSRGTILESSRRAAPIGTGTSARSIAPRETYVPPARPDRLDPHLLDGATLRGWIDEYSLLHFPDQSLDDALQLQLTRSLGEPEANHVILGQTGRVEYFGTIGNVQADRKSTRLNSSHRT